MYKVVKTQINAKGNRKRMSIALYGVLILVVIALILLAGVLSALR